MKYLILLAVLLSASTFTAPAKDTAVVNQSQGFYLYVESKPVVKFEYLGTVKKGLNERYKYNKQTLINRAKKEFPTADGLIFNDDITKADVIKLSE